MSRETHAPTSETTFSPPAGKPATEKVSHVTDSTGADGPLEPLYQLSRGQMVVLLLLIAGFLAIVVALVAHRMGKTVGTDDAYVASNVATLSAPLSGPVQRVLVWNDASVRKGQLLMTLDPRIYQYKVNAARAALDAAREKRKAFGSGPLRVSTRPNPAAVAQDEVNEAEAEYNTALLALDATRIVAPADGHVENVTAIEGTDVQQGQPLMAFVSNDVWVSANFKETELSRIQPGQDVQIFVDAYPGQTFQGHVSSIQAGTGASFSLLPPENSSGNWVKVVQRVSVRIDFNPPMPDHVALLPGMSVEPYITLK